MRILVPFYDLSYAKTILDFAKKYKFNVIVNPHDGPGEKPDKEWQKAIKELLSNKNIIVFGYIDMVTWDKNGKKSTPKSLGDLTKEKILYKDWYGISNNFFLDDFSDKMKKPFDGNCIANPGYDLISDCEYTMVWETENYTTKSKVSKVDAKKCVVFAMNEKDYKKPLDLAKKRGISMFYSVSAPDDWNAYNKLDKSLENQLKETQ